METIKLLKQLKREEKITKQAYNTYMNQISNGNEIDCIESMQKNNLITNENAESLIESYMFGYTE